MDVRAAIVLGIFGLAVCGVLYAFAGQFISGRFQKPSERRRDQRHKPLN